jgi:uncharacterized membrane protein
MSENSAYSAYSTSQPLSLVNRVVSAAARRWRVIFGIVFGSVVLAPFLAPVLMQLGLSEPASLVYFVYSFLCHQLPERSFFLFGPQAMYSLEELQKAGADPTNMFVLRKFIGSPELGWKVAWSDRMVWMYSSMLVFGLLWRPILNKAKGLPWWGLALFLVPMAVDGTSHFISDLAGIGQGFRASNAWLAELTGYAFSPSFYAGDAFGSFNSWIRLLTGFLFGLGVVWFSFPYIEGTMLDTVRQIRKRSPL